MSVVPFPGETVRVPLEPRPAIFLTDGQALAIASCDSYLQAAQLPTYTELLAQLDALMPEVTV